jgi:hypothetical protein
LCRIAAAERRTVAVHGETPSQYLSMLRLKVTRQALLAANVGGKTVTEIGRPCAKPVEPAFAAW